MTAQDQHAEHEDLGRRTILEELAALPAAADYAQAVRRRLNVKTYAHRCADYGGGPSAATPCRICTRVGHSDIVGDWSMSDVIRLPEEKMLRIQDALAGVEGVRSESFPEHRLQLDVLLEIVHRDETGAPIPFHFPRNSPGPNEVAGLVSDRVQHVGRHFHPSQHRERIARTYAEARCFVPLFNEADASRSGVYLLHQYGWQARKGARESRRYVDKDIRAHKIHAGIPVREDQWRFAEVAFLLLHPELAPTDQDRANLHIHVGQRPVENAKQAPSELPAEAMRLMTEQAATIARLQEQVRGLAAGPPRRPRGRPRKSLSTATPSAE